jgi:hypothetical protein
MAGICRGLNPSVDIPDWNGARMIAGRFLYLPVADPAAGFFLLRHKADCGYKRENTI